MRNFRRLPPLLRGANLLGLLLVLAAVGMFLDVLITLMLSPADPHRLADNPHTGIVALNLINVGVACGFPSYLYLVRWLRPGRIFFPLDSWQRQVRTFLLVTALPLGTLALAVVIAPTSLAFGTVFALSILETLALRGASTLIAHRAPAMN